jgi:hypothetical protein
MTDTEAVDFARAVAEHLDGWTATNTEYGHGAYLAHTDGRQRLLVRLGGWKLDGRAEIRGSYPASDLRPAVVKITVAVGRRPEHVAGQIQRRLLPRYAEQLNRVLAHVAERQAAADQRTATENELIAILPTLHRTNHGPDELAWSPPGRAYGSVKLHHDGEGGGIELHALTAEQITAVIRALAPANDPASGPAPGITPPGHVGGSHLPDPTHG